METKRVLASTRHVFNALGFVEHMFWERWTCHFVGSKHQFVCMRRWWTVWYPSCSLNFKTQANYQCVQHGWEEYLGHFHSDICARLLNGHPLNIISCGITNLRIRPFDLLPTRVVLRNFQFHIPCCCRYNTAHAAYNNSLCMVGDRQDIFSKFSVIKLLWMV